jgi:hypothetical protein
MSQPELAVASTSIVLRGGFNPAIFQPAWFAAEKLLPRTEVDAAKVDIITPQILSFSTEWLNLQVTDDRFSAQTQLAHMELPLRDLVLATFRLLRHTPIRIIGINYDSHINMGSIEAWHRIGHILAPKDKWKDLLKEPGTRSVTIEGERPDDYLGYLLVKVEPSNVLGPQGLYIGVNDHYDLTDPEPPANEPKPGEIGPIGSIRMLEVLESIWDDALGRAKTITEKVLKF